VKRYLWIFFVLTASACSLFSPDLEDQIETFEISTFYHSKFTIANGTSIVKITVSVLDENNQEIGTDQIKILHNGIEVAKGEKYFDFITSEPGTHEFQAEINGVFSNVLEVEARPHIQFETVELPLIFHVPESVVIPRTGRILREWVDRVNVYFNATYQNKHPNSYSPNIRFRLATTDQNGRELEVPGMNTYPSEFESEIKYQQWMWNYFWHPDYYINVWIGDLKREAGGYATYPELPFEANLEGLRSTRTTSPNKLQGILVETNFLRNAYISSNILQHELGHFLGLYHLHPCNVNDFAEDTFGYTDEPGLTCNDISLDSFNYMSYERDFNHHFTYSQVERMRYVIDHAKWIGQKRMRRNIPGVANDDFTSEVPRLVKPKNLAVPRIVD